MFNSWRCNCELMDKFTDSCEEVCGSLEYLETPESDAETTLRRIPRAYFSLLSVSRLG